MNESRQNDFAIADSKQWNLYISQNIWHRIDSQTEGPGNNMYLII